MTTGYDVRDEINKRKSRCEAARSGLCNKSLKGETGEVNCEKQKRSGALERRDKN